VLILGETGVGKEVMAKTLHERSPRAAGPLVSINCASFAESMLEAELFGYEKGAFTGALRAKAGLLELAQGGTLFLDEVGEMPLSLQAKLLRVLEQREVWRIGALAPHAIDARFVSATHRDLEREIAAGRFREDLYFRLAGVSLHIPPLRERLDEIEPLARDFLARAAAASGRAPPVLSQQALTQLRARPWPGNVRELRNTVERALLLCRGDVVQPEHLTAEGPIVVRTSDPPSAAREDERARIIEALERCAGNQTHAARLLGISRRTLITRIEEYDLPRPRKR
jgi:two-component system response regulator AtoC